MLFVKRNSPERYWSRLDSILEWRVFVTQARWFRCAELDGSRSNVVSIDDTLHLSLPTSVSSLSNLICVDHVVESISVDWLLISFGSHRIDWSPDRNLSDVSSRIRLSVSNRSVDERPDVLVSDVRGTRAVVWSPDDVSLLDGQVFVSVEVFLVELDRASSQELLSPSLNRHIYWTHLETWDLNSNNHISSLRTLSPSTSNEFCFDLQERKDRRSVVKCGTDHSFALDRVHRYVWHVCSSCVRSLPETRSIVVPNQCSLWFSTVRFLAQAWLVESCNWRDCPCNPCPRSDAIRPASSSVQTRTPCEVSLRPIHHFD